MAAKTKRRHVREEPSHMSPMSYRVFCDKLHVLESSGHKKTSNIKQEHKEISTQKRPL